MNSLLVGLTWGQLWSLSAERVRRDRDVESTISSDNESDFLDSDPPHVEGNWVGQNVIPWNYDRWPANTNDLLLLLKLKLLGLPRDNTSKLNRLAVIETLGSI